MIFDTVKEGPRKGELVRLPIAAPAIRRDLNPPRNRSVSGYGNRIPTAYSVRTIDNRWRRVYAICYSNATTLYVRHGKEATIVDLYTA
jgi:hypothetical protein